MITRKTNHAVIAIIENTTFNPPDMMAVHIVKIISRNP